MGPTLKTLRKAYTAAVLLIAVLSLAACNNTVSSGSASSSSTPAGTSVTTGMSPPGGDGNSGSLSTSSGQQGKPLGQQAAHYPWMIRLQHSGNANGTILATYRSFVGKRAEDPIFASTDEGKTFTRIAPLDPGTSPNNLCCTSLFELSRPVGALPAGTLLLSGAKNAEARPMSLPVWRSEDHGHSWSFLSTCYTSPNQGGVWEPEFSIDASGQLNCYFSDESDPAHSQMLARTVSSDGIHWGRKQQVVALPDRPARPGMAVVARLSSGQYFMTYELCGTTGPECAVHYRLSHDGRDWGNPATPGTPVVGPNGWIPEHTPKFTVTPDGRILLASLTFNNPDGSPAPGNGAILLVNSSGGTGPWSVIPAPVSAPENNRKVGPCTNYSPALLPVGNNGKQVLEITTRDEAGTCRAYYGTGVSTQ
ncbi:exo-alpha-sialidase [Streptantibioticus ferralitis]|uniref:Exo-alpha-sialidase n=1 Tax=Streptantibioticus ferralitis TaxID=236510 RepID=A0ABT5ZC72_9ACTN|nr:exo-alpha-sialidase [Streptantibioticus ferralitis]MDF2261446.1 exo-alpha-sialidase [Streptantibioticus ferralitis]